MRQGDGLTVSLSLTALRKPRCERFRPTFSRLVNDLFMQRKNVTHLYLVFYKTLCERPV